MPSHRPRTTAVRPAAPPLVHQALRGVGRALDPGVRAPLERGFGTDFARVRIHTDATAAASAAAVGARAYTVGSDIVFAGGAFRPEDPAGRRLLAHELAHVVQQRGAAMPPTLTIGPPDDGYERAAEGAATAVTESGRAQAAGPAPAMRLQRACAAEERDAAGSSASASDEEVDADLGGAVPWPGVPSLGSAGMRLQRDLATVPPHPGAPPPALTPAEIATANAYNAFRFKDPYTISFVRDVLGIAKYPAVADADLALAVAAWQAQFGLTPDGQVGPLTTRTLLAELRAEHQDALARLLRTDNFVTTASVAAPNRFNCGQFAWDVNFATTLRGGWLIQEVISTRTVTDCATAADATPALTPRYWEAWWVDDAGHVWIPTTTATPPGTAAPATADDLWHRRNFPGTRGQWTITGRAFTTLTLPRGFAVRGVPEAVDLPATVGPVNQDALGLVEGGRRIGGQWDCCDANPANWFHRPA